MRTYLFLLLLGFIFSYYNYDCTKEHISEMIKGKYNSTSEECDCPDGTLPIVKYKYFCNCFKKLDILACIRDKKCELNIEIGCSNIDINDGK